MRFHPVATNFPAGLKSAVQEKSTSNGLYSPIMTTVERDRIDDRIAQNGGIIYNEDVENLQFRVNNAWIEAGGVNTVGAPVVIDNIPMFANNAGTLLADSGFNVGSFVVSPPESLFSIPEGSFGLLAAPEVATVHGIGNLGYIQFINDSGLIFVDSLVGMQFIENNFGSDSQVCTLIASGLPSTSTSVSALLELKSTTGAFLNARMTTTQRDALTAPTNGMQIYNSTTHQMNVYANGAWIGDGAGSVSSITAGTGLTGGVITTSGTIALANTAVAAGTYAAGPRTIDAQGRITAASVDTSLVRATTAATAFNIPTFFDSTGRVIGDSGISFTSFYSAGIPTYIFDTTGAATYNLYIGSDTGGATVNTSSENTGVGYRTFKAITNGVGNTALGKEAGQKITSGSYNTMLGWQAGFNLTTASYNILCGDQAGYNLTSGGINQVFGHNALFNATTASSCIAFGNQALYNATAATNCFAGGFQSLTGITTGNHCIGIGQNAGSSSNGDYNVSFGYQAGFGGNNYTDSIFIGRQASASVNNLSNVIVLGAAATTSVSNSIILGKGCVAAIGTLTPASNVGLHIGTNTSIVPRILLESTSTVTAPSSSTAGIFSVNTSVPYFAGGTSVYSGGIATANNSVTARRTIGSATTNGTTGVSVTTQAAGTPAGGIFTFVDYNNGSGARPTNLGNLSVASVSAGSSFIIYSDNVLDVGNTVNWWIITTAS